MMAEGKRWPHGGVYEDLTPLFNTDQIDESTKETLIKLVDKGAFDRINVISAAELKNILNLVEYKEEE